ncbi:MAG: hydrogenase subunit MbhD domain-containing protein [Sulfolobales archaeon]
MDVTLILLALFSTIGLVFTYLAVVEKDLVKAVIFSAIQSTAYVALLYLLRAPDIVLVYLPVAVGLYPAAILFLIGKTEKVEEK